MLLRLPEILEIGAQPSFGQREGDMGFPLKKSSGKGDMEDCPAQETRLSRYWRGRLATTTFPLAAGFSFLTTSRSRTVSNSVITLPPMKRTVSSL